MAHIGINTSKAREIHKEHIRTARAPKLAEQDIAFQRALESGESTVGIVSKAGTSWCHWSWWHHYWHCGVTSVTTQLKGLGTQVF